MGFWTAIPVIGKVLDGVFSLIDKGIEDKDEANKLKAELDTVFKNADLTEFTETLRAQSSIIVAEAKGESWLQRSWRPLIMLLFGIIILNNYILNPWLAAMFSIDIVMEIPIHMWSLLKLGIGGYVAGRSIEKAVKVWKNKEDFTK